MAGSEREGTLGDGSSGLSVCLAMAVPDSAIRPVP